MPLTIFGDGAGAILLHRQKADSGYGVRMFHTGSEGHLGNYVTVPGGGAKMPFCQQVLDEGLHYWRFMFPEIHSWAVDRVACCTLAVVAQTGLVLDDIAWVVPHQASSSILRAIALRLGVSMEKIVLTYPYTGNLSAASIPVALDQGNREGRFRDREWLVLPAVGAGMAWGAVTYQWYDYQRNGWHD